MKPTPTALAETHRHAFTDQRAWSADEFASLLGQPGVLLIGTADSFVLARVVAGEAEILTLATAPAHQRQGLARQNLQALLAELQRQRVSDAFLEVAVTNQSAQALYQSAGFQQVGQRRKYYHLLDGQIVDAVVMAWPATTDKKSTE